LALLCQHFYPELISTGMHMTELATGLATRGWDITVYCAKPSLSKEPTGDVRPELTYQGVLARRVPTLGDQQRNLMSRLIFALTFVASTAWCVYRDRARYRGLIVTTNPPFIGLAGWMMRWTSKKPYVVIVYDVFPDAAIALGVVPPRSMAAWVWERVTRMVFRHATALVTIGRDMRELVAQKLGTKPGPRIALIPNWSDEGSVEPVAPADNRFIDEHGLRGKIVIQYAGRMGRTHNLEPLIEAARLLQGSAIIFQFVGEGAKRSTLMEMAHGFGLSNVQFLPYQPKERLAEMLSAATIAVVCLERRFTGVSVPSKTYGVMAGGKPILALLDPNSEIGLAIRENDCGVVMPDPDGAAVAAQLQSMLDDPEMLRRMGENGRAAFLREYTLAAAVNRYDDLLRGSFAMDGPGRDNVSQGPSGANGTSRASSGATSTTPRPPTRRSQHDRESIEKILELTAQFPASSYLRIRQQLRQAAVRASRPALPAAWLPGHPLPTSSTSFSRTSSSGPPDRP
jgi:glycosyltransferase involved in cell wall biosynthesis